jgi:hypothetical protein
VRDCDDAITSRRQACAPLANTQPGSFNPGCAGELSTIHYLLSANVTAEALASGESSVLALAVV